MGGGARPEDRADHVEVLEGGGSVKSDQVPRGKLWRVIKSAFICFCQAGDDIALFRLIRDDVHPYRINYCDGSISSRARQLYRDISGVPRVSDRNVVNVASSKMTAPLIKLEPCSGRRAYQHIVRVLKSSIRGRGAQVASAQAGTPQFIMRASFGEAAFANMSKGKAYLIFL